MKEADDIKESIPDNATFLGELSLDCSVKPVDGLFPEIITTKKEGFKIVYLPRMKDLPINNIEGIELRFVETLQEVIESFSGQLTISQLSTSQTSNTTLQTYYRA